MVVESQNSESIGLFGKRLKKFFLSWSNILFLQFLNNIQVLFLFFAFLNNPFFIQYHSVWITHSNPKDKGG